MIKDQKATIRQVKAGMIYREHITVVSLKEEKGKHSREGSV